MTDAPLDLNAIEARAEQIVDRHGGIRIEHGHLTQVAKDIPALLAEVRRLRERVAELEAATTAKSLADTERRSQAAAEGWKKRAPRTEDGASEAGSVGPA